MKKLFLELSFAALCAALLSACGESSGNAANTPTYTETEEGIVAETKEDLPNCTKNREGLKATLDEGNFVCTGGRWTAEEPVYDSEEDLPRCSKKREGEKAKTVDGNFVCVDGEWAKEIPGYDTEEDLPRCTKRKEGTVVFVEETEATMVCEDGEWVNASEGSDGSSSSDETDEGKSSASEEPVYESEEDLPRCSSKREGEKAKTENGNFVCVDGEWVDASEDSDGSSSSDETDEGKSSASEEPESSGSEGVEGSSASVSGEMVSCDIPGVMGECMEYPVGSDEAAQLTEFCVSMLGGTLGTGCAASTRDSSVYDADKNTLTDLRDGQTYKTITIAPEGTDYSEVWMAQNLNFVTDNSWCYGDDSTNCAKYGRLYTWAAAVGRAEDECGYGNTCGLGSGDIRGACPKGWHLPSRDEWDALFTAVGDSSTAGGTKLKSATGWSSSGNGTDAFGFSALPAGERDYDGNYHSEGGYASFRSSAEYRNSDASYSSHDAYYMYLDYNGGWAGLGYDRKWVGVSVRCLKD